MILKVLLFFVMATSAQAQDERFYRKIFTGELFEEKVQELPYKIRVKSKIYKIDLNRDGVPEGIITENRDGIDYLRIVTNFGIELFKYKLHTKGLDSKLFKIQLKTLSSDVDALVLHYYEGLTDYTEFEASARVYFVTIEKRDLSQIKAFKGPHFFHEKEKMKNQYWNRNYTVNVIDYNSDGIKEIGVSFNRINRIYFYLGKGKWQSI